VSNSYQQTPEWVQSRLGKVTASRIGDLMARTQKGWGAPRKHYLAEKVAERITGRPRDQRRVASLDQRLEMEPDARIAYEFYSDNQVQQVGFIEHPRIPNAGASPDGLIAADGGLEIKCPDTATHIETITGGEVERDYLLQCQFGMACTDRLWWDFVSFDPSMPEELKLFVKRIERDDQLIAVIEAEVIAFLEEVDQRVAQVRGSMQGKSPLAVALEDSLASLNVH
jgi:hypothetical protein